MSISTINRRPHRAAWKQQATVEHPHPRLASVSRLVRSLPGKRILDLGCSKGMLGMMLGPGYEYYGCDIAEHAAPKLPPGRFLQMDLNASSDLSFFRGRGIELAHLGVLEYLRQPAAILESVRGLLGDRGHMVVSLANFRGGHPARTATHRPGWVYRPNLVELRSLLARSGWVTIKTVPVLGAGGLRDLLFTAARLVLGPEHERVRSHTRQFLLAARAG